MLRIYINNIEAFVKPNSTILEACENLGLEVPRFCYHEKLSIAGNCRMCLVEVEKSPKPVVSCAMPVMNDMKIYTNTPLVKKARESILEFLLLNHPLDCPICDQGGECDLQDQTMTFGSDISRFYGFKRGVEDKNLGPLIKTIMTRCIHCTRCVRFSIEIAGVEDLGTTSRGVSTEIGTYLEKVFQSELSGNVIDLCPVGALTSKPYAFTSRPWELKTLESTDILDGIGSSIRVDLKENEIMRILPNLNEGINEEWISDKTRFSYDGLQSQRLSNPVMRYHAFLESILHKFSGWPNYKLQIRDSWNIGWKTSIKTISEIINRNNGKSIVGIFGNTTDLETQMSFKEFIHSLGSENVGFLNKLHINFDFPSNYKLNSTISRIAEADICLLVGVNPRYEGSLLNVRLRKRYLEGSFNIATIGPPLNLTYPVEHLGIGGKTLTQVATGKHKFCSKLKKAKKPLIILGLATFARKDSLDIQILLNKVTSQTSVSTTSWKGLGVLHVDSSQVGALDLGFNSIDPSTILKAKILYMVNISKSEWSQLKRDLFVSRSFELESFYKETWLISHKAYKESDEYSDILLPNLLYSEKIGTFINTEGRPQVTSKLLSTEGSVKEDWLIFRALSDQIGNSLKYNKFKDLQQRGTILLPSINSINKIEKNLILNIERNNKDTLVLATPFNSLIEDFYLTSVITRASKVMAECSHYLRKGSNNFR